MNERIHKVRIKAKLTQLKFAEKLGLSRNYIAMIENGQREPSTRTISDICREFGVNELWLRTGAGDMYAAVSREAELGALSKQLMSDSPESFRVKLVTTLLRFDPAGPEWEVLEKIYKKIADEYAADEKEKPAP